MPKIFNETYCIILRNAFYFIEWNLEKRFSILAYNWIDISEQLSFLHNLENLLLMKINRTTLTVSLKTNTYKDDMQRSRKIQLLLHHI